MNFLKFKKQFGKSLQKMGIVVALGMMMIPATVMARQVQVSYYRATCINANVFDGKMHKMGTIEFTTTSSFVHDQAVNFCIEAFGVAANFVQDIEYMYSYYNTESDSSGRTGNGSSHGRSRESCDVQNLSWQIGARINPPEPECN